jgi:hypothetical protein
MEDVGTYVYFMAIWYILVIWYIFENLVYFSCFGMLHQEKSGNPVSNNNFVFLKEN